MSPRTHPGSSFRLECPGLGLVAQIGTEVLKMDMGICASLRSQIPKLGGREDGKVVKSLLGLSPAAPLYEGLPVLPAHNAVIFHSLEGSGVPTPRGMIHCCLALWCGCAAPF